MKRFRVIAVVRSLGQPEQPIVREFTAKREAIACAKGIIGDLEYVTYVTPGRVAYLAEGVTACVIKAV